MTARNRNDEHMMTTLLLVGLIAITLLLLSACTTVTAPVLLNYGTCTSSVPYIRKLYGDPTTALQVRDSVVRWDYSPTQQHGEKEITFYGEYGRACYVVAIDE